MTKPEKKTRQEPVFLIEMPHQLRHMIMTRGQMLRSGRTRTLFCLEKNGARSWLQAKLIPAAGEPSDETWDKAHDLAARFKRELHSDVYVEPGSKAGRYQSNKVTGEEVPAFDSASGQMSGVAQQRQLGGFSQPPGMVSGIGGMGSSFGFSGMGMGSGMPSVGVQMPDPLSGLPSEVQALMKKQSAAAQTQVTCPAIRELSGWGDLQVHLQLMFETEAAQQIKQGMTLDNANDPSPSERSTLQLLRLQPTISRPLRRFLDGALLK